MIFFLKFAEPVIKQVPPELPPKERLITQPVTKTTLAPPTIASTSISDATTTNDPVPSLNVIPKHEPKKPEDYKEERRQGFVPVGKCPLTITILKLLKFDRFANSELLYRLIKVVEN